MKICSVSEETINITSTDDLTNCIYIFTHAEPRQSIAFDSISSAVIGLFLLYNFIFSTTFLVLKRRNKILSSVKTSYVYFSTIAGIFHVGSIFMTYGFFWPYINDAITIHTCSLWNFWFQWFLGFAVWISILFARIFAIAQVTIDQIKTENPLFRIIQRGVLITFIMLIILTIGILGEVFQAFYVTENHQCVSSFFIKLALVIWLIAIISILLVLSYAIKSKSLVSKDAHLINIELKIIKVTWPILLIGIVLNFTSLTIYPLFRFIFLCLVVIMYSAAIMIMFGNEVISYYFGNNQYVMAIMKHYELSTDIDYQKINIDIEENGCNPAIRETLDPSDDEHFHNVVDLNPVASPSFTMTDSFEVSAEDDVLDFNSQQKMKNTIKTNKIYYDFYCQHIKDQCEKLNHITSNPKKINLQYYDNFQNSFIDIEIPLSEFIDFMFKYEDLINQNAMNINIDEIQFILKFKELCGEYIDSSLSSTVSAQVGTSLQFSPVLKDLSNYNSFSEILLPIHNTLYARNVEIKNKLVIDIKKTFSELKSKLITDLFEFFLNTEGMKELKKDLQTKTTTTHLIMDELLNGDNPF